jgi:hypothetical protein
MDSKINDYHLVGTKGYDVLILAVNATIYDPTSFFSSQPQGGGAQANPVATLPARDDHGISCPIQPRTARDKEEAMEVMVRRISPRISMLTKLSTHHGGSAMELARRRATPRHPVGH